MTKPLPHLRYLLVLLVLLTLLTVLPAAAQTNTVFTSDNPIFLTLEGVKAPYSYASNQLLVNYNKATQKLECRLYVETLQPLNAVSPPGMASEVLFGSKYPELYLEIALPTNKLNSTELVNAQPTPRVVRVTLQGTTNETVVPVAFVRDNDALVFSTSFDLRLNSFQASVPVKYAPLLTGRLLLTIKGARWTNFNSR